VSLNYTAWAPRMPARRRQPFAPAKVAEQPTFP
jgi:hypothetical protein